MSTLSGLISAGGGSASFPTIFLHKSQTFVPPQDGKIMIHVIGAGGGGAANTSDSALQSGGAGAYCRKNSLAVTTSGSFTVVIGAGGSGSLGVGAGSNGGNTTFSGTGLSSTLTANGGVGGALSNTANTTAATASNGNVNYSGGRGGYQIGGGAVGLTGTGNDGTKEPTSTVRIGGACDVIGDFWSSSLGQISGGVGGQPVYSVGIGNPVAEPLAGAGSVNDCVRGVVPNATIGGGGGAFYYYNAAVLTSGRGGEGIVVIQYIP